MHPRPGAHVDDVIGREDGDLAWRAAAETIRHEDRQILLSGLPAPTGDRRQMTADNPRAWVRGARLPLRDASGRVIGVLGVYEDVTHQKHTETELQVSRERLEYALRGTNEGMWDWNTDTDEVCFSPRWLSMLGYRSDELPPRLETWTNLVDPADQERCFASAARRLLPGGSFVVEAFVPAPGQAQQAVAPRTITADRVVLSVSQTDPGRQEAMGQYVDITEAGIALRPWHIRWSTLDQLDAMAGRAGLVLADRWADWERTPFGVDAPSHVSRYQLAP